MPRPSLGTLGLALMVSGFLLSSFSLSRIAGWIPRGVLTVTLVLIIVQLGLGIRDQLRKASRAARPALGESSPAAAATQAGSVASASPDTGTPPPIVAATPLAAMSWMVGLLLAVLLLGTSAGTTAFAFAYLRWYAGESRMTSGVFALVLGVGIQLVFGELLQAQLYPGWLWKFTGYG